VRYPVRAMREARRNPASSRSARKTLPGTAPRIQSDQAPNRRTTSSSTPSSRTMSAA
jgi:hypothetical protein